MKNKQYITMMIGLLLMLGATTSAYGQIVKGKVFGGGQLAQVNGGTAETACQVSINSGSVYGKVYGAGEGVKIDDVQVPESDRPDVAKVTGNVNVNLNAGSNGGGTAWKDVFGGGALAKVAGSTHVTMSGGHIAADLFGGGEGNITNGNVTYANVSGNTNVSITGGDVIWDRTSMTTSSSSTITTYIYTKEYTDQETNETLTSILTFVGSAPDNADDLKKDGYKETTTSEEISTVEGEIVWWDVEKKHETNTKTYDNNKDIIEVDGVKYAYNRFYEDGNFKIAHNIFGGGSIACTVGTYNGDGELVENTGLSKVLVERGLVNTGLIKTKQWKDSYADDAHPHFYVFGGGYGEHTRVANSDVTVNVEGEYGDLTLEVDDVTEQLARPHKTSGTEPRNTLPVSDNTYGIPGFTVLGVLGGGYAGVVDNDTKVTVDGKTFLRRVFGGGFGLANVSTQDNTSGSVGGNTDVHVNGAHTYGDVFGGGAGVVDLDNVARVSGTTSVTIADDAHIYGNVYGGGDMACVGVPATNENPRNYATRPSSVSSSSSDDTWSYSHSNHQTFVNILGGDIFGEVYGGGKGVKKGEANDYTKVGSVAGNALVHIANSVLADDEQGWVVTPEATQDAIVPNVWNRIYGGCAYGTVDGNTMVHVEGGMLGLNIFGGGYGYSPIEDDQTDASSGVSTASSTLEQVLGKKDTENAGTYANVLGNTKVQIDGGSWIWNRRADTKGNITVWTDAAKQVVPDVEGFKELVAQIQNATTTEELKKIDAVKSIDKNFFNLDSRQFAKNHNIFGGGNRACIVGTYKNNGIDKNTGKSEVVINHSPITKIDDGNGNLINMLDNTTVAGLCWYLGINNIANPQFSVFGAGYGANTKVYDAEVIASPGSQLKTDGEIYTSGQYINEQSDLAAYYDYEQQIAEAWESVTNEDKKKYYGLADDNKNTRNTYLRYRASQMSWSAGAPNFTFMDIHGGGYSGYVEHDASVTADCQLTVRNIFGAGLGAKPYGLTAETTQDAANAYDFGEVGGDASVFIKSGTVSLNVYGGGAGIESATIGNGDKVIDFPNIARVMGKTNVDVYGEALSVGTSSDIPTVVQGKLMERTVVFGSVYGGGDVANVGSDAADEAVLTGANTETYTTQVNIRGGSIMSQIYAGGNGRLRNQCSVTVDAKNNIICGYKNLGAVYGNTRLIVADADKTYPYISETDNKTVPTGVTPHMWNRLYGGCQNGTVYGNTLVLVNGGSIGHNIFGGGFGDDGTNFGHSSGDEYDTQNRDNSGAVAYKTSADVTGNTNIFINGGEMELTSFWHPETRIWEPAPFYNQKLYSPQYDPEAQKFKINHNIYGGGNAACVVGGDSHILVTKGLLKRTTTTLPGEDTSVDGFNFFTSNEWEEVYRKLGSPHFAVFGGGYGDSTSVANTYVDVMMADNAKESINNIPNLEKDKEYLHCLPEQTVMDIVGGGYAGKVENETYVTVANGTFARRVFGGGFYNSVETANIQIYAIDCDDIFGGGLMGDVLKTANVKVGTTDNGNTNANIYVHGNIYGGNDVSGYINLIDKAQGEDVEFKDNGGNGTNIVIRGGHIYGNVYGAGNGNYLYALDKKGNTKVTVNEHYKLNENDKDEFAELVYTVPMRSTMASPVSASDAQKIVNINSYRPLTNKVSIDLAGNSATDTLTIDGNVFGGGNSATVLKADNGKGTMTGDVKFTIGNHMRINGVYLGSDGDQLFVTATENPFLRKFQTLNDLSLHDEVNWKTDPANHGISTAYLATPNENRPEVYPHLLDLYFQPVAMTVQPTVTWDSSLNGNSADVKIGTFVCGGNRGNMNVLPESNGNIVDITFPTGLVVTNKIVGGCNKANYTYEMDNRKTVHVGGYLLGKSHTTDPVIKLTVLNKFTPVETSGYYDGGNVYGGCYETGTINGDVKIDFRSDMLNGKDRAKIAKANELSKPAFNVYGAGYGLESYVYGDVNVLFGSNTTHPASDSGSGSGSGSSTSRARTNGDPTPTPPSANFVFGGGQMGNVIGNTTVRILNGEVMKSVTGGSYSGYQWGSSQVLVGYPKYYRALKSGVYALNRADKWNTDKKNADNSEVIKSSIHVLKDDIISQQIYDAVKSCGTTDINSSNISTYFEEAPQETPATYGLTWPNLNIKIGEAVYGGGYSLPAGSAVTANNTLVLKYTDDYNVDDNFSVDELTEISGSTKGFGGNSTIIVADQPAIENSAKDHIFISSQDMTPVTLPNGTDLFGYYYKNTDNTYKYIYQEGTYYAGDKELADIYKTTYKYDGEGGIYGDGHLSYVEGFRNAELNAYGFSTTTPAGARILNTFQRLDMLRIEDCSIALLGARDYTVNEVSTTPYSISRVGELQMVSTNVKREDNGTLLPLSTARSRNYLGLSNNIHYVGAITSDVNFTDKYHYGNKDTLTHARGTVDARNSYRAVKQAYVDAYKTNKGEAEFQKRNDGTAKNMIGISSGYALKIQNVYETENSQGKKVENIFYGPIVGVVEMNLIDVREGEGGGYVYADNIHHRHGTPASSKMRKVTPYTSEEVPNEYDGQEDFLETSGNFVFPYDEARHRYIVDDCFSSKYYSRHNDGTGCGDCQDLDDDDVHYWYVTGYNYYYNVHITGYTYDSSTTALNFDSDNKDKLTILSGAKEGQKVTIKSVTWRSAHPDDYKCDIDGLKSADELRCPDFDDQEHLTGYRLMMRANNGGVYTETITRGINTTESSILAGTLDTDEPAISFRLVDKIKNNGKDEESGNDYYEEHLSKPCYATIVLTADALDSDGKTQYDYPEVKQFYTKDNETYTPVETGNLDRNTTYFYKNSSNQYVEVVFANLKIGNGVGGYNDVAADSPIAASGTTYYDSNVPTTRKYTYTIYLTIDYVKGPNVTGHININNCVLPGEMIKLTTEDIKFDSDQAFAPTGYYWRIGKLKEDRTAFEGGETWNVNATDDPGFDTYKVGSEEKVGVFKESIFNKTENALYIPAYYYMNGYGVQFGFTTNSLDNMFPVASAMKTVSGNNVIADTLLVHNYHRMHPHNNQNPGMTLHLPEALARAKNESDFADPRIYIMDEQDLKAFAAFVDTIGTRDEGKVKIGKSTLEVPKLGAHGQFFLQNEITPTSYTAPTKKFNGTFHGDGYSVNFSKLDKNNRYLFNALCKGANIYNLGIPVGVITKGDNRTNNTKYHCCFTYDDKTVYRMDGEAVTTYTADDFRLGKVAYDLNQYYLDQRYVRGAGNDATSLAAQYVENYYRNGDYQYARRQDSDTKNNTGIIYLRNGESDIPGYGTTDTHHNRLHTIDAPRAVDYVAADGDTPESCSHFHPLFNEDVLSESTATPATSVMNDYLFFGQSLQDGADLADYPTSITSHRVSAMKNRVWRAAGYYRSTDLDAYHYNAYNQNDGFMQTFVHDIKTTAINFDYAEGTYGTTKDGNIFYAPVKDVASVYYSFNPKSGVSKNLLVYTPADDKNTETDVYTKVNDALKYTETTPESNIKGHQVVVDNTATAQYLHLVERAVETAPNNDFCCPLAFDVTDRAWYTRQPAKYAEANNDAWEGICLPFTANRVEASLNGEITHFYGTPAAGAHAADNLNTLHHEYWLRGLTAVADGTGTYAGKKVGTFKRPGDGLFATGETIDSYVFDNNWFVKTYDAKKYNKNYNSADNGYYKVSHTYTDYKPLTTGVPYIVSFPGYRFYEFDLSSKFYSEKVGNAPAQTVTFNAYGSAYPADVKNKASVQIPVTTGITTAVSGYTHTGTYLATENSTGIFSINDDGTAFKQGNGAVLPFRTYMTAAPNTARTRAIGATDVIYIGGTPTEAINGYDEESQSPEEALTGDYLILRPLSNHRIYVKSTYATTLMVYTASGQLYRVLDVKPGAATYSGFAPGIYVANKQKINVE